MKGPFFCKLVSRGMMPKRGRSACTPLKEGMYPHPHLPAPSCVGYTVVNTMGHQHGVERLTVALLVLAIRGVRME